MVNGHSTNPIFGVYRTRHLVLVSDSSAWIGSHATLCLVNKTTSIVIYLHYNFYHSLEFVVYLGMKWIRYRTGPRCTQTWAKLESRVIYPYPYPNRFKEGYLHLYLNRIWIPELDSEPVFIPSPWGSHVGHGLGSWESNFDLMRSS